MKSSEGPPAPSYFGWSGVSPWPAKYHIFWPAAGLVLTKDGVLLAAEVLLLLAPGAEAGPASIAVEACARLETACGAPASFRKPPGMRDMVHHMVHHVYGAGVHLMVPRAASCATGEGSSGGTGGATGDNSTVGIVHRDVGGVGGDAPGVPRAAHVVVSAAPGLLGRGPADLPVHLAHAAVIGQAGRDDSATAAGGNHLPDPVAVDLHVLPHHASAGVHGRLGVALAALLPLLAAPLLLRGRPGTMEIAQGRIASKRTERHSTAERQP